jgi:hypothetical protein
MLLVYVAVVIVRVRDAHSGRTPSTHPEVAPPTTCYPNTVRSKEQTNDAHHTLAQYKATGNHDKLNVAVFAS